VFESEVKHSRKITKDIEFTISDELAGKWAESFKNSNVKALAIEPNVINLTVTPGRLTTAKFLVDNGGVSTVSIHCRVNADGSIKNWLELKSPEFTLGSSMRRNVICMVKVPQDAQPGQYCGTIEVEMEHSGLTDGKSSNIEKHNVPIHITVSK